MRVTRNLYSWEWFSNTRKLKDESPGCFSLPSRSQSGRRTCCRGISPYEHLNVPPGRGQVGYEITLGLNSAWSIHPVKSLTHLALDGVEGHYECVNPSSETEQGSCLSTTSRLRFLTYQIHDHSHFLHHSWIKHRWGVSSYHDSISLCNFWKNTEPLDGEGLDKAFAWQCLSWTERWMHWRAA